MIKCGLLHNHTENSRKDSCVHVKDLIAKAISLGAPAIAITDHGVLTGIEEAKAIVSEFKAKGKGEIKIIPGVEAYFFDELSDIKKREHLILLAKNADGYRAISLAVTESNKNIDSQDFPIVTMETLNKCFGNGTIGHGNVVATSACMNGILASVLLMNDAVKKEIAKVEKKQKSLNNPNDQLFAKLKSEAESVSEQLKNVASELDALGKVAKRTFAKREIALTKFEGTPEYAEKLAALNADKKETEDAINRVEELKKLRSNLKIGQKTINNNIKPFIADEQRFHECEERIKVLNGDILSANALREKAEEKAKVFADIFGIDDFYCEVQYHGIDKEKEVMPVIAEIAHKLGIHLVAANDAHMLDGSEDSIKARQIIRSFRFNKWEDLMDGDKELYLKTDEELVAILSQILPEETVNEAMNGIGEIVDKCNVVYDDAHHYPKFVSEIAGEDAVARLRRLSQNGIAWRYPNNEGWDEEHEKRMEYELSVIKDLGFCDYLCIVEDFLSYGRLLGRIDLNDERFLNDPHNIDLLKELADGKVGIGIGPGRGSAVGSLVCYLVGITGIDPMKYDLIFERFLNKERVSMPDIDSDFKPDIRTKVLDYVKYKYGEDAVCCIMTKGTLEAKGSVRGAARLLGSEKHNDTSTYLPLGDSIAKAVPAEIGMTLDKCDDKLTEAFGENATAMEIIHNAKLIEGTFLNVGMHAAGVIISDNGDVKQYAPLMYNSEKGQWMTQCEKDPCEASLNLLKMDFLGLRNLGIITETLKTIKARTGKSIDIEKVPFEKEVFSKIFATGNTNSVFQFESGGMKKMLRQFQPESIEDIILLVAAYRPGPMQYLESIIAVKHGLKEPEYVIPEMEEVLGTTYGYPVYQEQIMKIFNKFAGFTLGESDIIRRYMSKKKTEKFMAYKDKFIEGLCNSGAIKKKAEDFWDELVDFSKYAFNKSHATAYAFVAYYTAWLKCFYPAEYLCSVMNDTMFNKLGGLIADCKGFGLKVMPADINRSGSIFSVNDDGIVVGLSLVKGVSESGNSILAERDSNGKFTSFADFMIRTKCKKDVAESLAYVGAFDEFTKNRQALVDAIPEYVDLLKKLKTKEDILNKGCSDDEKEMAKMEKAMDAVAEIKDNIKNISINTEGAEDLLTRLEKEEEKIGAFISGHPLDSYGKPADFRCTNISELEKANNVSVMGIITGLRVVQRKKDGADLAFFTIEDQSGSIDVNCFVDTYKSFKKYIQEDAVVIINGNCVEDVDNITDETVLKFNAKTFKSVECKKQTITINIDSPIDWAENVMEALNPYRDESGLDLVVFDCSNKELRTTNIKVKETILLDKRFDAKVV